MTTLSAAQIMGEGDAATAPGTQPRISILRRVPGAPSNLPFAESRAFAPGTFAAHAPRFTSAADRAAAVLRPAPRRRIFVEAGG